MAVAADVPSRFDVVINGFGYTFLRTLDGSYPSANRHRAEYTATATFVERQNTGQQYGDNQQDFFMTVAQKDWGLGEGTNFFDPNDQVRSRQYLSSRDGYGMDISQDGRISPAFAVKAWAQPAAVVSACPAGFAIGANTHIIITSTNLYHVSSTGTTTDKGAHGAGTPNQWGVCSDGVNVYIAGATKIRKWNGTAFSDFAAAATNAGALAFLNNTLFSCDGSVLKSYDGTGAATTLFTWKDATNTALAALSRLPRLFAHGPQLMVFWPMLIDRAELWTYDGTTHKVAELPEGVIGYDGLSMDGIVFMSGNNGTLWFYQGGTIGVAAGTVASASIAQNDTSLRPLGTINGNIVFAGGKQYNPATGAISTLGPIVGPTGMQSISSTPASVIGVSNASGNGAAWPDTLYGAAAYVTLSKMDLGNTLTKHFRSIKVEYEDGGTGVSGGMPIDYSIDGAAFLGLAAPANSGTEYLLPADNTSKGRTIQVRLWFTTGNGGLAYPFLKRVYVRAAPILQSYKVRTYNLDLSAIKDFPTQLQDGSYQPLSGFTQAQNLQTAITSTLPISITDKFGTFTGVCEPAQCSILELHSEDTARGTPGQYIATITVREV